MSRKRRKTPRLSSKRLPLPRHIGSILETLLGLGTLFAMGYGFYLFAVHSDFCLIKTITVEGFDVLEPEQIVAQSSVTDADNMLFVDPEAIRERVKALPYVKTCKVTRVFPNRLLIAIDERQAVATLQVHNRLYEIDGEGVVLRKLSPYDGCPAPFITNVPDVDLVSEGQLLDQRPLKDALAVWAAFRKTDMAGDVRVAEIAAFHENDIRMYCKDLAFEIRWGRGDFESEAARLDTLWRRKNKQLDFRKYVDLRFGNDLACR